MPNLDGVIPLCYLVFSTHSTSAYVSAFQVTLFLPVCVHQATALALVGNHDAMARPCHHEVECSDLGEAQGDGGRGA